MKLIKLNASNFGCSFKHFAFSAIMYANDLLLLAPSVLGMQKLIDVWVHGLRHADKWQKILMFKSRPLLPKSFSGINSQRTTINMESVPQVSWTFLTVWQNFKVRLPPHPHQILWCPKLYFEQNWYKNWTKCLTIFTGRKMCSNFDLQLESFNLTNKEITCF